jgi:uncharacterized membrane protein YfcA
MDLPLFVGLAVAGFAAGLIGALLGLGGGIILVPALTLGLGLPFGAAAGVSLVAVAATSAAGASAYVQARLTNIRLAVLLGTATVAAAIVASLVAQQIDDRILRGLFAALLVYTALSMLRSRGPGAARPEQAPALPPPAAGASGIHGSYFDRAAGQAVGYEVTHVRLGLAASLLGGALSGLLGVGGGLVQTPIMHLLMGVPLKVATGTSSFLIGITAAASALIYYSHGRINPMIAAPAAIAVFAGARAGAYLVQRLPGMTLKRAFGLVALLAAGQMILQTLHACPWCAAGG